MTWADVVSQVEARAGKRCEYCHMHQSLQGATFHVDHIVPTSRGGITQLSNLAWTCPGCNLKKSDLTETIDPITNRLVRLFNPRIENWTDHFRWDGCELVPLTSIARAMINTFDLKHPRRRFIREAERLFGLFDGS